MQSCELQHIQTYFVTNMLQFFPGKRVCSSRDHGATQPGKQELFCCLGAWVLFIHTNVREGDSWLHLPARFKGRVSILSSQFGWNILADSNQSSWFGFLTLSGSFLLLLLRFTEWITGCHSPTANVQTDHRGQNANFWGWHRRPLPPGSLRSPFPTQTYIPGTWNYLNLPHMPSCFTLWMLFWGKNVQNSLKILSRVVQMPKLPCRYHRTMYVCTIYRKLNTLMKFNFTLCLLL